MIIKCRPDEKVALEKLFEEHGCPIQHIEYSLIEGRLVKPATTPAPLPFVNEYPIDGIPNTNARLMVKIKSCPDKWFPTGEIFWNTQMIQVLEKPNVINTVDFSFILEWRYEINR